MGPREDRLPRFGNRGFGKRTGRSFYLDLVQNPTDSAGVGGRNAGGFALSRPNALRPRCLGPGAQLNSASTSSGVRDLKKLVSVVMS